ncbi:MAG: sulfotransferase domain-containing protein [Motiliproteus sp.]
MKRVHIIGPPRSGTTLMLELMTTCFQFSCFSKKEVSLLEPLQGLPSQGSLCTKNPQDHRLVSSILPADENQWFISMVRDPRDIVVSRHGLKPDAYWANLNQWRCWLENTRGFHTHPRLVEVRYEELVARPDKVQETLAAQLDFLPATKRFSNYDQFASPSQQSLAAMRSIRKITGDSIGNWKKHLPRLAGQIEIHGSIAEELIGLGYEDNDLWMADIKTVEPDLSPGHWPEFPSPTRLATVERELLEQLPLYLKSRGLLN